MSFLMIMLVFLVWTVLLPTVCVQAFLSSRSLSRLHIPRNIAYSGDGFLSMSEPSLATENFESEGKEAEEKRLNTLERLSRSFKFYSNAIPLFAQYKMLEFWINYQKDVMGMDLSEVDIDNKYKTLHEYGSTIMRDVITELKGFYVKTGQIISTRVDIFPFEYTSKLAVMQDALDPVPGDEIKKVVRKELLGNAELSELFLDFDDEPLGSASIAQVHRATLLDGRQVAVKVQRPNIEPKLLGDIENLKQFAKLVTKSLPIDYFKIFSELERTLIQELDFFNEAQATVKVATAVAHNPKNVFNKPPVTVPLPISGLVSKRVMVLEYIQGRPLSKIAKEISEAQQLKENSVATSSSSSSSSSDDDDTISADDKKILFGNKLLTSLTDAYSNMIFGSGIIHGDPHPGNIFVLDDKAEICLLDCGQFKQITTGQRIGLAKLIVLVNKWEQQNTKVLDADADQLAYEKVKLKDLTKQLANGVKSFGVIFKESPKSTEAAAAVAILLFGNSDTPLPGGFVQGELDTNSPIAQVQEFPQEFILLGRATVMIKGIAKRLELSWSLSDRWAAVAQQAISATREEAAPIWAVLKPSVLNSKSVAPPDGRIISGKERLRFKDVLNACKDFFRIVKAYFVEKANRWIKKYVPVSLQKRLIGFAAKVTAAGLRKSSNDKGAGI